MKHQKLSRAALRCVALCAFLSAAAAPSLPQAARPAEPAKSAPAGPSKSAVTGPVKSGSASLPSYFDPYHWSPVASIGDYYDSNIFPQPVCAKVGADFKIYIFTNYDSYPGDAQNNNSQNVRVGEFSAGPDTYQRLAAKLPGRRHGFAAASVSVGGNDHTVYLFGGMNGALPTGEVYSYTPATQQFALLPHQIKIDSANFVWGARTGALAVPVSGKIYLFGGQHGNNVLGQVQEFDPSNTADPFRVLPDPMPAPLVGARGMAKAAPGGKFYIYVVGGSSAAGQTAGNPNVYRFEVPSAAKPDGKWETVKQADGSNLTLPPGIGAPMATWDMNGRVRIVASSDVAANLTWGKMQTWILNDDYNVTTGTKASLTARTYDDPARARDRSSAVKCGSATYLIGGTTGQGSTAQNVGRFVDKLAVW